MGIGKWEVGMKSLVKSIVMGALVMLLGVRARVQSPAQTNPTIAEATIRSHMEFLASDAMNGRGSGTEDEWRAAEYIGAQLRRWGVEPLGDAGGFVQRVDNGRAASSPPRLSVAGLQLTHGQEMLVQAIGGGSSVAGQLRKHVAGATIPAGSFLLLPPGISPDASMSSSAAAILMPETPAARTVWESSTARPLTAAATSAGATPPAARIILSTDSYTRIAALTDGTRVSFTADTKPRYTWNALGQLTGSDASRRTEVILLTAHLDHLGARGTGTDTIYNGADDDASGTTAVLALAEAIASGARPHRTVMFAWFGSEESGGVGARNFLATPPVPLDRIVANIEFEMIGRPDDKVAPHTLWLTGYERSDLGPELARQGARIVADPHPEQRFFTRSDNIQLACAGVVAQTVSSFGIHPEYHRPNDDLAHIDFAHMTESIASMLAPLEWLGNSTFTPAWLPGQKPAPGNPCRR